MSAKLLPTSNQVIRTLRAKALPIRWMALDPCLGKSGFLSSWVSNDYEEQGEERRRIKWRAICGMAMAFAIGAGFWAGVGLLISRLV